MTGKVVTALGFLRRGDLRGLCRQVAILARTTKVRGRHGAPFVHNRLGFGFVCFPGTADSVEMYVKGSDEDRRELSLLRAWVAAGDGALDVGSNLGVYAAAAAQAAGATGRVMAVEPSPSLAGLIGEAARLLSLGGIRVYPSCAGDARGQVPFHVAKGGTTGAQSLRVEPGREAEYETITVGIDTLDHMLAETPGFPAPSFVKVDVEGAEVSAIRGASDLLGSPDPALWIVEINPPALARFGTLPSQVTENFAAGRFERWLIPKYPRAGSTDSPRPLAPAEAFGDALFYNLVAIPKAGKWSGRAEGIRRLLRAR